MAGKRRGLTDIVMSGLLTVLCASLIGCSLPANARDLDDHNSANADHGLHQPSLTIQTAQDYDDDNEIDVPLPPPIQPAPGGAQEVPGTQPGAPAQVDEEDTTIRMIADEVGHDENLGIFVARGHVEILREGRIVKADVVTYNERTKRITASGNVVLIEPDGDIQFATYADVTDDVKEGILYDFRMLMKDNARLAANRAYRVEQDTKEILRKGVYTPCAPCAEDPSRAPLWQVKAYSAIRHKVEETITYHDAWLEMFGVPVLYTPWFRHPDFGVDRQSGMLTPELHFSSENGLQISTPYYHVLAPDKDITFTPIFTFGGDVQDRPGGVAMLEYRQRVVDGRFRLEGSGTVEDRESDAARESDVREISDDFRGHVEGEGLFEIDDNWRTGFDFKAATDKSYLRRFHLGSRDILTQTAYLEGFFGRSYAEAQAYTFQTTDDDIDNDELPIIAPMLDYRFVGEPGVAGGYLGLDANFMNLRRLEGREVVRIAANPYWTLPYTSSMGDIYRLTLEMPMTLHAVHEVDPNSDIRDPSGGIDDTEVRVLPKASLEWRYPFIRPSPNFTQVLEPIIQVVGSPDSGNTGNIPNEDSRAFELDDTNLFLADRFPGLDRKDTGSRATYGAQWSAYTPQGGYINAFLGQSFQFEHDDNDEFRTGTGIDDDLTDAVGRLQFRPISGVDLSYRFRFDAEDVVFQRHEARASYYTSDFALAGSYAFIASDGIEFGDREQVSGYASAHLSDYWSVNVRSSYDLQQNRLLSVGSGFRYLDECFDMGFDISYAPGGDTEQSDGEVEALFTINFRNLGGLDIPY
ncbi:LPS-assembly protein LptD [Dongia deserti]|uniref:LPS-assembly protein LptD n=1 Tax=Dongia deserti TaxID=2268030 RepID=UPI0013C4161A|nr:LPS assembly protein LptD [Dongia deserti]